MGVFKEHAKSFEAIEQRQSRVYTDACDYGVTYNKNNIPDDIQLLINMVKDLKNTSLMKSCERYFHGVEIVFEIAWEIDEGMEYGTRYTINANKLSNHVSLIDKTATHMISVESKSYRIPYHKS